MKYIDISHDKKKTYTLGENEKVVFFLHNRPGDITFRLTGSGAEAHIFALFSLSGNMRIESKITQVHFAQNTTSSLVGRSVLSGQSTFDWQGLIKIKKSAALSDGHQEMRNLLLSEETSAFALPSLEIENNAVRCGHATATSAPNKESLFFLRSRGFSESEARRILVEGFIRDIIERLPIEDAQREILFQSVNDTL
jgi:Fe-S cluster assembly protein SufD